MKWYKKLHRELKRAWDKDFRPILEPVIRLVIGQKLDKEIKRHTEDK